MRWVVNWIATFVALHMTPFYFLNSNLSEYLSIIMRDLFHSLTLVWIILAAGLASIGYGGAILLQRVIMKDDKFKTWLFMTISLLLSVVLTILIVAKFTLAALVV